MRIEWVTKRSGRLEHLVNDKDQNLNSPDNDTASELGDIKPEPASRQWSSYAFGLAFACLMAIALSHVFGIASPELSTILMVGIVISGTIAWAIQARQNCPHCGTLYGYGFRIVNAHICKKCGGDFRDV